MALLLVALRAPNSRPWKAEVNDKMERSGDPGAWFFIQEASSSAVSSISDALTPACLAGYDTAKAQHESCATPTESCLKCGLVGTRTAHGSEHLVETRRGDTEKGTLCQRQLARNGWDPPHMAFHSSGGNTARLGRDIARAA